MLTALNHALRSRDVQPGQLIFHSDKGAQYTALRFTQRLVDAGVAPSTGSTGDSYDNALAENLWSTIKVELLYWPGTTFATRVEAEHALIRYIETSHQPKLSSSGRVRLEVSRSEGVVAVVELSGEQAVVEFAEHAVEHLA